MKKFVCLSVVMCCIASILSAAGPLPPGTNYSARRKLSADKRSFTCEYGTNAFAEPYMAMRRFKLLTREVEQMFSDKCFERAGVSLLPAWAGIYAAKCEAKDPDADVNKLSNAYILSQLYRGRFRVAEAAGKARLEATPDDYGTLALLGLMAMYEKGNFPYLEKAFDAHPEHTLYLMKWYFYQQIPFRPAEDWDFVAAFFQMLNDKRERWDPGKLPVDTRKFLRDAFAEKYGNFRDAEERKGIPEHLLKLGAGFGGPELDMQRPAGADGRIRVSGRGDHVIVRRLGPGNAGTAAKTPRPVFVWDLDSELRWNWLMANWRTPGESCVDIGTDGRNALVLPESIGTPARVRVDSNTSDASLLASLPRSVTALECDLRYVKDWSFLRSLSLKELRIVPFGSNFDLKMLSHMPLKRLVVANMGNTKDWWEPLVNLPLESLAATNAGFLDVSVFARLRVRELSLVNCVFDGDPLA